MAKKKAETRPEPETVTARGEITQETLNAITAALEAKGLDTESVPAEFAESQGLKSRDLTDLTETKGQALLSWLNEIPDDQPVEPDNADEPNEPDIAAADNENADSDNGSGNSVTREEIRKAEDVITVKRPLNAEEQQENMSALFELASRRTSLEFELDGLKNQVKARQKEIDGIDLRTYKLIHEMEENEVEEDVEALRITNHTTGMITWYDRNTGEVLREKAINTGDQLPLDLAGEAADRVADDSAAKPDAVRLHGTLQERTEDGVHFLVRCSDEFGTDDLELEIPHDQIVDLRTRVLEEEDDCIIVHRTYAIEVGIITEPEEAPESVAELLTESEEQGCSVCAYRDSDDGFCQECGDDLANFMPVAAEPSQDQTEAATA